ncbi:MAG: flavin reductase [Clostridia bacterium]
MFKEYSAKDYDFNAFKLIGDEWMLVTAEKDEKVNSMTASWGGVGILWGKPVAFVFVRPQRYTKEFIDNADGFSLSVLPDGNKDKLTYFGKISGRDEDKIAKTGFTVLHSDKVPYFEDAEKVFILKKLYEQKLDPDCFIDKELLKNYPRNDFHHVYVAEIEKILVKE